MVSKNNNSSIQKQGNKYQTIEKIKPYLLITFICFVCVLVIISYGVFRCKINNDNFVDPLTKSFAPPPFDQYLDGWGISHFSFFAILAYFFPKLEYLIFIWILGVLWEIVEYMFKDHPFYISKCSYKLTTDKGTGWWYGRWQDIVMNTLGIIVGYSLTIM